jgi:4-methyl-5(b-hydroxyethyl)-thiazole monophosphate biosynthesis
MSKVLVLLAHGSEEIEAVTVIDLLRRAEIDVLTAGNSRGVLTASRGVRLVPDAYIDDVLDSEFDMVVLPGGGPGAESLKQDARVIALLQNHVRRGRFVGAICAAPKILAHAGILEGKRATSFPGILESLDLPNTILSTDSVVIDGAVVTSRGPGTSIDFALALIALLEGHAAKDRVEAQLQRPVS